MPGTLENDRIAEGPAIVPTPKKASSGKMSMALVNFWIDAALFADMIFIMWVTAMLQLVFPPPTEAAGWSLWRLSYNDWHRLQLYALCLFAFLAVEHLVLHWNWVCAVIATQVLRLKSRSDHGNQAVYGVGTFITILVLVMGTLLAAMVSVRHVP